MARSRFDTGSGPSKRQLRVGELLRRALSDVLSQGRVHDPDLTSMSITVGEVTVSADLRVATVWVLPLGGKGRDVAIAALARNMGEIRHQLTKEVDLKHSPELRFRIDETFDRMDQTRAMFADESVRRDLGPNTDEDQE